MANLPTVVTKQGMQPMTPTDIHDDLIADVEAIVPGYTANLPGALIEDISSTDVAAIVMCDSARVETVNSLTPYGANAWLLNQLGNDVYGVPLGQVTNTTVDVVFNGPPGFIITPGFTVSDGVYDYVTTDGGVVGSGGRSLPITFIASQSGSWSVPAGTVTDIVTSIPNAANGVPPAVTCSNPLDGVPGLLAETESDYRVRVLQAGLAAAQGMPSFAKTILQNVPGVVPRLISMQQTTAGWKLIVGGGDVYDVAFAIYSALIDVSTLVGSILAVSNITTALNAVVTTAINHNFKGGEIVTLSNVLGMTGINGVPLTVTVIDEKNFSTGVSSALMGAYTGGGTVSPNNRNRQVSLSDYPDVYTIVFVSPPNQTVGITVSWNTLQTTFVNDNAIAQLGAPAVAAYVNSVYVGQPMNITQLERAFLDAISSIIAPDLVSTLTFAVSINGVGTAASPGTDLIYGDPESYFSTPADGSSIIVERAP